MKPFFSSQQSLLFFTLIFSSNFISCIGSQQKVQIDSNFYKDCLETIQDKEKCDALVKKSKEREKEKEAKQIKLTQEQLQGLEIRDDFKARMFGKSRLAVISSIGEPEERTLDGNGQEYFVYLKPLTRYSAEHDPDKEIIIVFKRQFVSKVLHTQPDSTPKSIFPFFGDKPKGN